MLTFIKNYESVITVGIAFLNLCIAGVAWLAAKKSADAAIESTKIASAQADEAVIAQKQNTAVSLLDHRVTVYNQLAEWLGYANVICSGHVHYSKSLERFYSMVLRKTNYVPLDDVPSYDDLQIDTLLIRLSSERDTIMLFSLLFTEFNANEYSMIDNFVTSFTDMILHIDEEMGKEKNPFYYANRLQKVTSKINEVDILGRMRNEMRPVQ